MGNSESGEVKKSSPAHRHDSSMSDPRLLTAFKKISHGDDRISENALKKDLGQALGSAVWRYLCDGKIEEGSIDFDRFSKRALPLTGTSTDVYVEMLLPVDNLLRICLESAGVYPDTKDGPFLQAIAQDMQSQGNNLNDIISWKTVNCPKMCSAVQAKLMQEFMGIGTASSLPSLMDYSSDVLSPSQMWFLQCALPPLYFPKLETTGAGGELCKYWTPLYSSAEHGISVNRFESNVFGYRGPTVSIFVLSDGQIASLALDQEWRNSATRFGGSNTVFLQFSPSYKRIESTASVSCNFKQRGSAGGISFEKQLNIDKDMNNVREIEVWGCSGVKTLQEQQKLKQWQARQVEKNKKVPLPGNWDDNPDKFLLEMAGFGGQVDRAEIIRRDQE